MLRYLPIISSLASTILASPLPQEPVAGDVNADAQHLSIPNNFDVVVVPKPGTNIDPLSAEVLALGVAVQLAQGDLDQELPPQHYDNPSLPGVKIGILGPKLEEIPNNIMARYIFYGLYKALSNIAHDGAWQESLVFLLLSSDVVGYLSFESQTGNSDPFVQPGKPPITLPPLNLTTTIESAPEPAQKDSNESPGSPVAIDHRLVTLFEPLPNARPLTRDGVYVSLVRAVIGVSEWPMFPTQEPIPFPLPLFNTRLVVNPPPERPARGVPANNKQLSLQVFSRTGAYFSHGQEFKETNVKASVDGTLISDTRLEFLPTAQTPDTA